MIECRKHPGIRQTFKFRRRWWRLWRLKYERVCRVCEAEDWNTRAAAGGW